MEEEEKKKEMEAAKEDAPKEKKQKRWLKMLYCRGSRRGHSHPMLTNYKKSLMLCEENGKLKADLATLMAEKVKQRKICNNE
jgi:hypothetical protein